MPAELRKKQGTRPIPSPMIRIGPFSPPNRPSRHPSANAQWIEGYGEWDAGRKDYLWVTGTWRLPPPGRFWVNGYWKRDEQGWYRVPAFWGGRKADRLHHWQAG